jgi:hypothetical protein
MMMNSDLKCGMDMLEKIADGDFSYLARGFASAVIDEIARRDRRIAELEAKIAALEELTNTSVDDDIGWAKDKARRLGMVENE